MDSAQKKLHRDSNSRPPRTTGKALQMSTLVTPALSPPDQENSDFWNRDTDINIFKYSLGTLKTYTHKYPYKN